MFEFLKEDFEEKYNFIINQINPQVTARLNTFTTAVMGFVEKILREIKPENINIYNKDGVLISKTEKIGFVNFYHCLEFSIFMKNDFGFDLKEFKDLKIQRNRSGSHIENLNIQLDVDEIRKYYKTLFKFLKAYYEYKTNTVLKAEWDDVYFEKLLITQKEKIVEIEKLVEVEKIIEKQVVDKSKIKQKENKITELKIEAEKKNLLINDLQEKNQEYESQAKKYKKQTEQLETHYENELNKYNLEKNELRKELEKQKVLTEEKDNELKRQKSLNKTKDKEILELKNLSTKNSFQIFWVRNKKKILYSILAFACIIVVVFSVFSIVKNSTNKLFYDYSQSDAYVCIGKNYDSENLIIPSKKNGKPITRIVSNGGYGNDFIVSVEIPDSVQIIDNEAFKGFKNLQKVIIRETSNLQKINIAAFKDCNNLENFYIPENVTYISANAFENCVNLNYVNFECSSDWCIDDSYGDKYSDIQLTDEINNAQLLTSINIGNNWYKKFYISYNLNGGIMETNPNFFTIEDSFSINNPTKYGYVFLGWTGTEISQSIQTLSIENNSVGNRVYVANWTPIQYTITYITDGGSHTNPNTYTIESGVITLNDPIKINNKFLGWYESSDFSGNKTTQILSTECKNVTLYAKWTSSIVISTASDLIELSNNHMYWGGEISLMANINLNGIKLNSIGNKDYSFTGTFNGNGYVLSNFTISTNTMCLGFFGVTNGATIKNLGLENYSVFSISTPFCCAGGIVGYAENTTIRNCYSLGNIAANGSKNVYAGGIIGYSFDSSIWYCYSGGNVTANNTDCRYNSLVYAGGIVGYSEYNTIVMLCFSVGIIKSTYNGPEYSIDRLTYKSVSIGMGCVTDYCYLLKGQQLIMDYINTTNGSGYNRMYDILVAIKNSWDMNIWSVELPESVDVAVSLPQDLHLRILK